MQTDTITTIILIVLAGLGIFALLLTMGYMVYGEQEEE